MVFIKKKRNFLTMGIKKKINKNIIEVLQKKKIKLKI